MLDQSAAIKIKQVSGNSVAETIMTQVTSRTCTQDSGIRHHRYPLHPGPDLLFKFLNCFKSSDDSVAAHYFESPS